jgi:hypothetical protein
MTERGPAEPEDDWGSPQTPWSTPQQPPSQPEPSPGQWQEQQLPQPPPDRWQQPTGPQPTWHPQAANHVRNYLIPAIAATLLCCLPTGIVAIVYSSQSQSKLRSGDVAGAIQASNNARLWLIISVVAGLVAGVIYVIVVAANSSGSSY